MDTELFCGNHNADGDVIRKYVQNQLAAMGFGIFCNAISQANCF